MPPQLSDPYFRVEVLSAMPNPQQLVWAAMHQDYSENFVFDERDSFPAETRAGELIVKHLLAGNRGHYGCYSADTEVLTEQGWMFWPDLFESGDNIPRLLAVDIERGECRFEKPSAMQAVEIEPGDHLYQLESQYLNFAVTHDHRMIVSARKHTGGFGEWHFRPASEVYGSPVRYLLNSCLVDSERTLPSDLPDGVDTLTAFRLAGFFFGDGQRSQNQVPRCIRFRIRRPRKIAYLLSIGLPTDCMEGDRYTIRHPALAAWIHRNFSSDRGKVVPRWILTLPKQELAAFWDGLKNSDGTRITDKSWAYDSVEKKALDLIQAAAHINGFSANMTLRNPNEGEGYENHRPCWRLHIAENSTRRVETCQQGRTPGVSESWIDYSGKVYCASVSTGALMVRRKNKVMVSGNCIEHPQIAFNVGYFPHSTMQQLRTHRVGISFDCQSLRYTGKRIVDAVADVISGKHTVEEVFYLRPPGHYADRQGGKYFYSPGQRQADLDWCLEACKRYKQRIEEGLSEEHARGLIPFDVRQHFVMSCNARSLMHILDLRAKADAQLEIQKLCDLLMVHFKDWMPGLASWYETNRLGKARLSP